MQKSTDEVLTEIETRLYEEFPNVKLEFATQSFTNHVELWIYVLTSGEHERIQDACRHLTKEMALEERGPEIWLLPKAWTGPWPGGESLQEIERRREEFKRAHNWTVGTTVGTAA